MYTAKTSGLNAEVTIQLRELPVYKELGKKEKNAFQPVAFLIINHEYEFSSSSPCRTSCRLSKRTPVNFHTILCSQGTDGDDDISSLLKWITITAFLQSSCTKRQHPRKSWDFLSKQQPRNVWLPTRDSTLLRKKKKNLHDSAPGSIRW